MDRCMSESSFDFLNRQPKRLASGDHLLLHYALRCLCSECGKLLRWECEPEAINLIAVCCGMQYKGIPRTVVIEIENISDRPILPLMNNSMYSDPNAIIE